MNATPPKKRRRKLVFHDEEEIGTRLIEALQGGSSIDKFFKQTLRRALELQYDISKANARVEAALSGR